MYSLAPIFHWSNFTEVTFKSAGFTLFSKGLYLPYLLYFFLQDMRATLDRGRYDTVVDHSDFHGNVAV